MTVRRIILWGLALVFGVPLIVTGAVIGLHMLHSFLAGGYGRETARTVIALIVMVWLTLPWAVGLWRALIEDS